MDDDALEVLVLRSGGYMVRSQSVPGAWRLVVGKSCSCPAGRARTCRHRRIIAAYVTAENRKNARPSPPPHISALVD